MPTETRHEVERAVTLGKNFDGSFRARNIYELRALLMFASGGCRWPAAIGKLPCVIRSLTAYSSTGSLFEPPVTGQQWPRYVSCTVSQVLPEESASEIEG